MLAAMFAPPAARAQAPAANGGIPLSAAETPCVPAAHFLGATLCEHELEPPPGNGATGEAANIAARRGLLQSRLWSIAVDREIGTAAIAVSEAEIEDYNRKFEEALKARYETNIKTRDLIASLLRGNRYAPVHEQALQGLARTLAISIHYYEAREQQGRNRPAEVVQALEAAQAEKARAEITVWKIDRVLFDKYGGRLARQEENRVVPVDAYARFVESIVRSGKAPVYVNTAYDRALEEMGRSLGNLPGAETLPESDPAYGHYFSSPDWRFSHVADRERFEAIRARLMALPALPGPR